MFYGHANDSSMIRTSHQKLVNWIFSAFWFYNHVVQEIQLQNIFRHAPHCTDECAEVWQVLHRVSATSGYLLEFVWSSWKFLYKMLMINRIGLQS